jgi:hypothetical protein
MGRYDSRDPTFGGGAGLPGSIGRVHEPSPGVCRALSISKRHKTLYAELFEYLRRQDYPGKPEKILAALPGFQYTTAEQFMRSELFAI